MKRFKSTILAVLAVFVAVAYVLPAASTLAVSSSAALSIVPKKNYVIEPGKTIRDTLIIRNMDRERPLELNLRVVDFTYSDDGGTPKLMLDEDAPQTTWSLKPFMTIPESVTVQPGKSATVNTSVAIPANQGAGSYYSAIVYSSGSSEGGNVGLSASGVTLAFVNVPGDVNEKLELKQFGAYNLAKAEFNYFNTEVPGAIAYKLKNSGNVAEAPVGSITMKHMFGKEQALDDVNPNQSLALIGQERTFTACIKTQSEEVDFNGEKSKSTACAKPFLWPGYYNIKLDLYYGQNGNRTQELTGTGGFWYLPLWFIVVFIIVMALAAFYTSKAYRNIQSKLNGGSKPKRKSRRR